MYTHKHRNSVHSKLPKQIPEFIITFIILLQNEGKINPSGTGMNKIS